MKKIFKEMPFVLIKVILYLLIIIFGMLLMSYPALGMIKPVYFISMTFYAISFFTIFAYFIKRNKDNYELLLISLNNIIIATFMFVFQNETSKIVLGTSIIVYTLFNISIKGLYAYRYKNENNYIWTTKLIELVLLVLIGSLTAINLYSEMSVITLMFGYYFITYGIINLLEPIYNYLIESGYLKEIIKKIDKNN